MPTVVPSLKVTTKSVFACELLLAATMDVDKICNWLRANHVWEITSSQKDLGDNLFWAISFCTDNSQLVSQLQNRCKEKNDEILKQKDQRIESLASQLKGLHRKLEDLQSKVENQNSTIISLNDDRARLRHKSVSLRKLESDHLSLRRAYQDQNSELVEVKSELKRLQPRATNLSADKREIVDFEIRTPINICIVCGGTAMPGQGQCLDCAR